jgi:hypothetical protein
MINLKASKKALWGLMAKSSNPRRPALMFSRYMNNAPFEKGALSLVTTF